MATTSVSIRDRVAAVCTSSPFSFVEAVTPFDFTKQPNGQIDRVFRITVDGDRINGWTNYTEERTDSLEVWLARKQGATPHVTYAALLADAETLRAAVIRDGVRGDYDVPDGGAGMRIEHEPSATYAVLRLTLSVNYEVSVA